MANVNIPIPSGFIRNMSQFVANVQKMQQLVNQFQYQVQNKIPVQNLYSAHNATKNRFQRLLQIFRKLSASMQSTVGAVMRAMGTAGQAFLRGISLAADFLGPIIAATVTTVTVIAGAALSAFTMAARFMRWFWDKMVGLGDAMLSDFLQSSGMLASVGGLRAYRGTFGAMFNDPTIQGGSVEARGSIVSRQYMALQYLGIRHYKDTADMMVDAYIAASHFMKMQTNFNALAMADALNITSIFNPRTLIALRGVSEEELQSLKKMYDTYKPIMQVTDKAKWGWMNFSKLVQATGAQIITIIANKLADRDSPLVQSLHKLSESFMNLFKIFLDSPLTKAIVKKLSDYVEKFSKMLEDPTTQQKIDKFLGNVEAIVKHTVEAIKLLDQIYHMVVDKPSPVPRGGARRALARHVGIERRGGAEVISPAKVKVFRPGIARPGAPSQVQIFRPARAARPGAPAHPAIRRPGVVEVPRTAPTGYGKQAGAREAVSPPTGGRLTGGQINSSDLYNEYKKKFTGSSLDGFVPADGARWGIKKGTPDEWARLATSVSKQESGLNANSGGGGLNQFEARDLANYGVSGAVNDPNAQTQALVNQWTRSIPKDGVISQPAPGNPGPGNSWLGAGRYFGSMRDHGWHGKTQADVDKYLGPGGWGDRAQAAAQGAAVQGASTPATTGPQATAPGAMKAATGQAPEAFIMHHTGGREASGEAVQREVAGRGLGVEYVMERDGTIKQIGQPGAANIMPESRYRQTPILGEGKPFLTNKNIVGMEVIAKDDKDVTPAQIAAARQFIKENYPNTPVFGHGEVNPGHKEPDEGKTIVDAIRDERRNDPNYYSASSARTQTPPEHQPSPFPEHGAKSVPYMNDNVHPINRVKVDNRSDSDVVKAKENTDTSDADALAGGVSAL